MHQTWRFGVYEADTRRVELRRGGKPVKMREQSFLILVYLLEHADEIVTREELRRLLWPSGTFVDFDHSLNMAVVSLRDALGDSTDAPLYIETIPRRGYRFIAPVSAVDGTQGRLSSAKEIAGAPQALEEEGVAAADDRPAAATTRFPRFRYGWVVAVALVVLTSIGLLLFLRAPRPAVLLARNKAIMSTTPSLAITAAAGNARAPILSPDETWIAYLWNGPARNQYDLYVQRMGSSSSIRLTHNNGAILSAPAWSPDGKEVAFARCDGKNNGVFAVSSMGGAERKLATGAGCLVTVEGPPPVAWLSEDRILMVESCPSSANLGLAVFSLANSAEQCLATLSGNTRMTGVTGFLLSPDGNTVAFRATTANECCDLYVVPFAGGEVKQLTFDLQLGCGDLFAARCNDYMWAPDSHSIIFFSNQTKLPWLWRVSADGGPIMPETEYPAIGALSKDGQRLIFSEPTNVELPSIWQASLTAAGGPAEDNRKIIGVQEELAAQPSSNGRKLAWTSRRTGSYEVWIGSAKGENPIQITYLEGFSMSPRWSPDGKRIAFAVWNRGNSESQIYVVDAESRNLYPITTGHYWNDLPSWSRDGKSVYFTSSRTGRFEIWKHSMENGAETPLTHEGGVTAFESSDGTTVYFSKIFDPGLWSVPSNGGRESVVLRDLPRFGFSFHWAVTEDGIYYMDPGGEPRPTIDFYRFATRSVSHILTLDKQPVPWQVTLSATTDGKTIYYSQQEPQGVLKMIEFPR
jgi:Tol biopolymer transport system component/DNA-binding winged helix-turn-helix (wHTH) protein